MSKYRFDPWWPAIMALAGVVTLSTCGVSALGAFSLVLAFNQARQTPILDVSFDPYNLLVVVIYLFIPFALWRVGWLAHDRMRRRARAIAGDPGAMPVALLVTSAQQTPSPPNDTADAPIAAEPLHIIWRERAAWRWLTPTTVVAVALFVSMMFVLGVAIVLTVIANPLAGIGVVVGLLGVGFMLIVASLRRRTARQLSPAQHITELIADEVGLTWLRPLRREVVIPWAAARLLEVSMPNGGAGDWRIIQLYGVMGDQRRVITWLHATAPTKPPTKQSADYAPIKMTLAELAQHQGALLALIRRRTGLTPHTFDDALTNGDARQAWFQVTLTAASVFWFVTLGIAPLIAAMLILVLPLTRYPLANGYGALTLATVGVGYLTVFTRGRIRRARQRRRRRGGEPSEYILPPTPVSANDQYLLAIAKPARERLYSGIIGVLGLLDGVVVALAFAAPGHSFASGTIGHGLDTMLFYLLVLVAVIALYLLSFDTLRPAVTIYGAAADGLSMRRNIRAMQAIPWRQIALLHAVTHDGELTGFQVVANDGKTIEWSAKAPQLSDRRSPLDVTRRITPDELASLVVARTGLPLTLRQA